MISILTRACWNIYRQIFYCHTVVSQRTHSRNNWSTSRSFGHISSRWSMFPTLAFFQSRLCFLIYFSSYRTKIILLIYQLQHKLLTQTPITWLLKSRTIDPHTLPTYIIFALYLLNYCRYFTLCQQLLQVIGLLHQYLPHFISYEIHFASSSPKSRPLLQQITHLLLNFHYLLSKNLLANYSAHLLYYTHQHYHCTHELLTLSPPNNCTTYHHPLYLYKITSTSFLQKSNSGHLITISDTPHYCNYSIRSTLLSLSPTSAPSHQIPFDQNNIVHVSKSLSIVTDSTPILTQS